MISHKTSITGSTAVQPPNCTEQMICCTTQPHNNRNQQQQLLHTSVARNDKDMLLDNPRPLERKRYCWCWSRRIGVYTVSLLYSCGRVPPASRRACVTSSRAVYSLAWAAVQRFLLYWFMYCCVSEVPPHHFRFPNRKKRPN